MTIVAADMRTWEAPAKADILVSELLGSFGDNELSPECLDGAQRFLREDGISIPSSYTSYLQPITTCKLWNDVKVRTALAPPFPNWKLRLFQEAFMPPPGLTKLYSLPSTSNFIGHITIRDRHSPKAHLNGRAGFKGPNSL